MDTKSGTADLDVARLISDFSEALSRIQSSSGAPQPAAGEPTIVPSGPVEQFQPLPTSAARFDRSATQTAGAQFPPSEREPDRNAVIEEELPSGPPVDTQVVEDFLADREILERLSVTASEIEALREVRLCGSLTDSDDVLQILRVLRDGSSVTETAPAAQPHATPDTALSFSEHANRIRREAMAKLSQLDLAKRTSCFAAVSRTIGAMSSALLMAGVFARHCASR
jgi:hypothetical protein